MEDCLVINLRCAVCYILCNYRSPLSKDAKAQQFVENFLNMAGRVSLSTQIEGKTNTLAAWHNTCT